MAGSGNKTLNVPKTPSQMTLHQWKHRLERLLLAYAPHIEESKLYKWVTEIETLPFEDLCREGRPDSALFQEMDRALAVKMVSECDIDVLKDDNEEIDRQRRLANKPLMSGRQHVYKLYEWFRTTDHLNSIIGLKTITTLKYKGDNHMRDFLHAWKMMSETAGATLSATQRQHYLATKVVGEEEGCIRSVALKFTLDLYDSKQFERDASGNTVHDHSEEYLLTKMIQHLKSMRATVQDTDKVSAVCDLTHESSSGARGPGRRGQRRAERRSQQRKATRG